MQPIETTQFWQEEFEVTEEDLESLYEQFVDEEKPRTTDQLVRRLIAGRAKQAERSRQAQAQVEGAVYQPKESYDVGDRLVFPAFGDEVAGEVVDIREGQNPEYGAFKVIQVHLEGDGTREFASEFSKPHVLNIEERPISVDDLADQFGDLVRAQLTEALAEHDEFVRYGDEWILKGLLPEIHVGYRNIAEAMIVVAGEALPTERLLEEIELPEDIPLETRKFALNQALTDDERFINVGAISEPLWALSYEREESA